MPEPFSFLMFIPAIGTDHELLAIGHAWIATLIILLLAVLVSGRIKRATAQLSREDLIPEDSLTLRNTFELYVEGVLGVMEGLLGHNARKFFWLIGTLFIYIFISNLMGIVPGFLPSTENINTNLAMSLIVFLVYNFFGIKAHGVGGYLKHFMGPVAVIAPAFLLIELISHMVRPASLAIRLFGNINGDHIVLSIFSQILPSIFSPVLAIGVPIPFIGLGMFVSFMQAFVFSMLTTIYIAMAVSHEH